MQCEKCCEVASVQVTEVTGGKAVDHCLCNVHASGQVGAPFSGNAWKSFFAWLAEYLQSRGEMPSSAEISSQGEVGARLTKLNKDRPDALLSELRSDLQKHLV
jgi:hypothetical protein